MLSKLKILILFFGFCLIIRAGKCECENDRGYHYSLALVCKNISGRFPPFPTPVTFLKCENCDILVIDEKTIEDTTNLRLETFNLSHGHIHNISSSAFKSYNNITMHNIIFEDNEINYIGKEAFRNFKSLDLINLQKNSITHLDKGVFSNTNLTTLDLSFNRFNNISFGFEGLRVNKLNLSHNELTLIPQNAFDEVIFWEGRQWRKGIQYLDLSYNLIYKIVPNTFKSSENNFNVRYLYLQGNKITVIENNTFGNLTSLTSLHLEENQISTLYNESFKGLKQLTSLELNKNNIKSLPVGLFFDLQHLNKLNLAENEITTLSANTFSGLIQLTTLNISFNPLKVLDEQYLYPLGRLVNLDVSATNINSLNVDDLFEHHFKLMFLSINDNFWTCADLLQMYKILNRKTGGFNNPSHHYDVPNLHGIACSRQELSDYEDMTFDEFLKIISQDRVFEDFYDSRFREKDILEEDITLIDIKNTLNSIQGIFYMVIVITLIVVIIFLQFIIRCVFRYLYWHRTLTSDKFSFMYARNQDNVELIN